MASPIAKVGGLSASDRGPCNPEGQAAHDDWDTMCEIAHRHALVRAKEINRVARVHRDPFEPILSILEAESPLGEYRKITEEVRLRRPDRRRFAVAAAESTRSFLMLRLGLHLGLRQKNLRELLFKPKGQPGTPERQLEVLKRGELRWSMRDEGWEVLVPAVAFKNAGSTFSARVRSGSSCPTWAACTTRSRPILLAIGVRCSRRGPIRACSSSRR
ncbi:hypothetical protein [Caulobacter sp. DWP3-1-3b2]|uniref:hypothetical protein n=1 Tax=Caulobacter sp. DWP3-1-3b2 TaxID=2804643 RepID=UPI003CEBD347